MPMVIEPLRGGWRRRQFLAGAAALALAGAARASERFRETDATRLVAAWADAAGRHHVGLLEVDRSAPRVVVAIEVPTRAHGLAVFSDGSVLAVARRPGDWLLRWHPTGTKAPQWLWAEGDRRFNGHVLVDATGQAVYTTEVDVGSGQGRLVRRDPVSLEETAVWQTRGADPHDMELLSDGRLLVANGGIPTWSETGRVKHDLDRMDPSLALIDVTTGNLDGQWRLPDPRLSIRHLAQQPEGLIGVALQAEHADPAARAAAPVFALFDPAGAGRLQAQTSIRSGSGYGGDVAALRGNWLVSCPRENQVQRVSSRGELMLPLSLEAACALAPDLREQRAWTLGLASVIGDDGKEEQHILASGARFDNHAVVWPVSSR